MATLMLSEIASYVASDTSSLVVYSIVIFNNQTIQNNFLSFKLQDCILYHRRIQRNILSK